MTVSAFKRLFRHTSPRMGCTYGTGLIFAICLTIFTASNVQAQTFGPFPSENLTDQEIVDSDAAGITIKGVRPSGIYSYRYVELSDSGSSIDHVITGPETDPLSARGIIRASMDRWEAASGGMITWQRCDNDPGNAFGECDVDAAGNPVEVVIGISPGRVNPIGCSLPWRTHHDENDPFYRNRRFAFNDRNMSSNDGLITHELGHCLGLSHIHQRADRSHWLSFRTWEENANHQGRVPLAIQPVMENFAYSSPMNYPGTANEFTCKDEFGVFTNAIGQECVFIGFRNDYGTAEIFRRVVANGNLAMIQPEVASEIKQRHARVHVSSSLGYFNTLNRIAPSFQRFGHAVDLPLDPALNSTTRAYPLDSPALVASEDNDFAAVMRGSDEQFYIRRFNPSTGWDEDWIPGTHDTQTVASSLGATTTSDGEMTIAYVGKAGFIRFAATTNLYGRPQGEPPIDNPVGFAGLGVSSGDLRTVEDIANGVVNGARPVLLKPSGAFVGPALLGNGGFGVDLIAVRDNGVGDGELIYRRLNSGIWSAWDLIGNVPADLVVTSRPSVFWLDEDDQLAMILATARDLTSSRCGYLAIVTGVPAEESFDTQHVEFFDTTPLECNSPVSGVPDGNGGYHAFAVNELNQLVYRHNSSPLGEFAEIGGLPKPETGVAVAAQKMFFSPPDTGLLMIMNGSDIRDQYTYNNATATMTANSLQAGGLWFRRWGWPDLQ